MKRVLCICIAILMFVSMFAATSNSPAVVEITTYKPLPKAVADLRICGLDGSVRRVVPGTEIKIEFIEYTIAKALDDHILYWFNIELLNDEIKEDEYLEFIIDTSALHIYAYVEDEEMEVKFIEGDTWAVHLRMTGEVIIMGD